MYNSSQDACYGLPIAESVATAWTKTSLKNFTCNDGHSTNLLGTARGLMLKPYWMIPIETLCIVILSFFATELIQYIFAIVSKCRARCSPALLSWFNKTNGEQTHALEERLGSALLSENRGTQKQAEVHGGRTSSLNHTSVNNEVPSMRNMLLNFAKKHYASINSVDDAMRAPISVEEAQVAMLCRHTEEEDFQTKHDKLLLRQVEINYMWIRFFFVGYDPGKNILSKQLSYFTHKSFLYVFAVGIFQNSMASDFKSSVVNGVAWSFDFYQQQSLNNVNVGGISSNMCFMIFPTTFLLYFFLFVLFSILLYVWTTIFNRETWKAIFSSLCNLIMTLVLACFVGFFSYIVFFFAIMLAENLFVYLSFLVTHSIPMAIAYIWLFLPLVLLLRIFLMSILLRLDEAPEVSPGIGLSRSLMHFEDAFELAESIMDPKNADKENSFWMNDPWSEDAKQFIKVYLLQTQLSDELHEDKEQASVYPVVVPSKFSWKWLFKMLMVNLTFVTINTLLISTMFNYGFLMYSTPGTHLH